MNWFGVFQIVITILFVATVFKVILPARGVKQITADELRDYLKDSDVQLIDVRPEEKYNQSHIYGFKNIPVGQINKQVDSLDKDKLTITICQTGAQGNRACKKLKRRGFKNLANVHAGLSAWEPIHNDRT